MVAHHSFKLVGSTAVSSGHEESHQEGPKGLAPREVLGQMLGLPGGEGEQGTARGQGRGTSQLGGVGDPWRTWSSESQAALVAGVTPTSIIFSNQ